MSTEDVNTGAKWTAHFTNWQSKRNNKAECNQSHLHHEQTQRYVDECKVGAANVSSNKKRHLSRIDKLLSEAEKQPDTHELHPPLADGHPSLPQHRGESFPIHKNRLIMLRDRPSVRPVRPVPRLASQLSWYIPHLHHFQAIGKKLFATKSQHL